MASVLKWSWPVAGREYAANSPALRDMKRHMSSASISMVGRRPHCLAGLKQEPPLQRFYHKNPSYPTIYTTAIINIHASELTLYLREQAYMGTIDHLKLYRLNP